MNNSNPFGNFNFRPDKNDALGNLKHLERLLKGERKPDDVDDFFDGFAERVNKK